MGPILDRTKQTELGKNFNISHVATTVKGWGESSGNYYQCAPLDQNLFFAIYDGFQGSQMATYTKMNFLDLFQNHSSFKKSNYKKALFQSILIIDELLASEKAQDFYKSEGMEIMPFSQGSSIHILFIHQEILYLANLGTTRTLACINGVATQLNPAHNFYDESELKRILAAGGNVQNHALDEIIKQTRALGMHRYKDNQDLSREEQIISGVPEIQEYPLNNVEFLLTGSAGLFDKLSDQQIIDFVRNQIREQNDEQQLKIAVENLVDHVIPNQFNHFGELKCMSNISVILIYFNK